MKGMDILLFAVGNVRRGGVKSVFCALALCVGICSVCTISALGSLALEAVGSELSQIGVGGIAFYAGSSDYAVDEDAVVEVGKVQGVSAVMQFVPISGWITLKNEKNQVMICGVNEKLGDVFNITLLHGRLLTSRDVAAKANVVIIDEGLAQGAYRRDNIVGKSITLTFGEVTASFEVVGVIRSQKQGVEGLLGMSLPNFVYVPYSTVNQLSGTNKTKMVAIKAAGSQNEEMVAQTVAARLSALSSVDFKYENLDAYTDSFQNILSIVSLLAWGVAAISILVGGIGVMNSMVSAVESRTRDIGILMSLGARKRDILKSFLTESLMICTVGGTMGAGLSILLYKAVAAYMGMNGGIQYQSLAAGILGAAVCGVIFGLLPAWRAAGMNPIDAIREE